MRMRRSGWRLTWGGSRALVRNKRSLDSVVKGTDFENLDLLPADFSYRHMDLKVGEKRKPTKQLLRLLMPMSREYDLVFLDCPPSISLVSENIFRATDLLLVPIGCSDFLFGEVGHAGQTFEVVVRGDQLNLVFAGAGVDDCIGKGELVRMRQIPGHECNLGTQWNNQTIVGKGNGVVSDGFVGFAFDPLVQLILHRGRHEQIRRISHVRGKAVHQSPLGKPLDPTAGVDQDHL